MHAAERQLSLIKAYTASIGSHWGATTREDISHRALLSSAHQSNNTLTNIIDIPAGAAQEGGRASKGHLAVGGGLHLHVAALCVLARQPRRVSNGSVWIFTVQGAGAVAAHGVLDVICSACETRAHSASPKMRRVSPTRPPQKMQIDTRPGGRVAVIKIVAILKKLLVFLPLTGD